MPDTEEPTRVRPLSARESGAPIDDTLYPGVPAHLRQPIKEWLVGFLTGRQRLARRVAASLRLALGTTTGLALVDELAELEGTQLLDAVDFALQRDDALEFQVGEVGPNMGVPWEPTWDPGSRADLVEQLDELLSDGASAYTVVWTPHVQLARRVDPTVVEAASAAIRTSPTSGAMLASAWRNIYGLRPEPNTAYRDAVRAVEALACPLVLPDEDATLGKVIGHLKQGGHKWRFVLVDRAGADDVGPVVAMLDRLWTGQVSRHGGGKNSRDQSKAEAEAAVHLAATLVQLLSTGALNRRDGS